MPLAWALLICFSIKPAPQGRFPLLLGVGAGPVPPQGGLTKNVLCALKFRLWMVDTISRENHLTMEYRYDRINRSGGDDFGSDQESTTSSTTTLLLPSTSTTTVLLPSTAVLLCPAATATILLPSKSASSGKSLRATGRIARLLLWTAAPSDNVPDRGLIGLGEKTIM